jgi:hydrogenase maturation protease
MHVKKSSITMCEKEARKPVKTLVLGLGNPILRDDRVGLQVLEELEGVFLDSSVTLQTSTLAGINLLEILVGFDRAIIVDAIQTGGEPGSVYRLTPQHFIVRHALPHLHNMDFFKTLLLARNLIPNMPKDVIIVGIEVGDALNFGENLTPEVERSIPSAVEQILEILKEGHESTISKETPSCPCPQRCF